MCAEGVLILSKHLTVTLFPFSVLVSSNCRCAIQRTEIYSHTHQHRL
jgi:hypothetical protein